MSSIVDIEDRLGAQLLLCTMGVGHPPVLAGRYTLLELRGRGARGLVCRARDLKLGRDVALKIYPATADDGIEDEVIQEARALAKLEHVNVVGVIDFGQASMETDGASLPVVYLCMEFIDGRSMRTWRNERSRRRDEILNLLSQAGAGLAAAHGAGLVHRDFKPENVMIESRGRVLVVDFGLASSRGASTSSADAGGHASGLTAHTHRAGFAQGTIEYMAPEARRGTADAKSDQFSFAATAWESLTGVLPFDAHEYDWRHPGQDEFHGAKTLAPALRAVLERALSYFAHDRYPSMVAMLQALAVARGARRRVAVGVAAGLGLLAVAATAIIAVRMPNTLEVLRAPARDAPQSSAAAIVQPDEPQRACDIPVGRWQLQTMVVRSEGTAKFNHVRGWYVLEVDAANEPCGARVRVAKVGSSDVGLYGGRKSKYGTGNANMISRPDGSLELGFDVDLTSKQERLLYRFDLVVEDDQIRGDWHLSSSTPLTGFVFGRRIGDSADGDEWSGIDVPPASAFPCASQCRVVCDDAAAARRCARDRCTRDRTGALDSCSAP